MNLLDLFENISAQQRRVGQLPADFRPPQTSPQLSGPYPGRNATQGYLVGEGKDRVDSLVTNGLPMMRDATWLDAVAAIKYQVGQRDYRERKQFYDFFVQQLVDRKKAELAAKKESVAEAVADNNPMAAAVVRRILNGRLDLLQKYGAEAVLQAVEDVTDGDNDWEEIGSSDVSAYVKYVEQQLQDRMGSREEMSEGTATTEDVLSAMKKKLGDYLQNAVTAIKTDPTLKDKLSNKTDLVKAVKTIRTDDGHEIKINGNEDDGFRISIRNREMATPFKTLDEAVMASEMYCARRRTQAMEADYIEEK